MKINLGFLISLAVGSLILSSSSLNADAYSSDDTDQEATEATIPADFNLEDGASNSYYMGDICLYYPDDPSCLVVDTYPVWGGYGGYGGGYGGGHGRHHRGGRHHHGHGR